MPVELRGYDVSAWKGNGILIWAPFYPELAESGWTRVVVAHDCKKHGGSNPSLRTGRNLRPHSSGSKEPYESEGDRGLW